MDKKVMFDYFNALHKDRSDTANTLEKPSMRGIWRSVTDKYSDQAHFIYELIQNADDAGAKSVHFILEPTRLIFIHNGVNHFSISNPETEENDSNNGKLGDINAITSAANSNKSSKENKIGKFGVGFKAVFQYTTTPYIYDTNFKFKIDRYIVPTLIDEDYPNRKENETVFVFPFNHKDKTTQECYMDIEGKLKSLSHPILFLSNLRDISYEIENTVGLYGKVVLETIEYEDNMIAEKIHLMQNFDNDIIDKYLWMFTRCYNGLKYSVGFFIDENNHLVPVNEPAFCYFPTKETTGLKFLIHAPFLLTDSREGIRSGVSHNNKLIELLAEMSGLALLHLRDIGESNSVKIIDDNIFSIIPYNEDDFCDLDDTSKVSFMPFYIEINHIFKTEEIIPTRTGFTKARNSYWAAVPYLSELFTDEQLSEICANKNAHWAFVSLGRDEVQRNNKELFFYINEIVNTWLNEQHLIRGRFKNRYSKVKDINGITESFIENQSFEWLCALYKWLSETSQRTELAKYAPIFLDQDSKATAAYFEDDENEHLHIFLPSDVVFSCRTIRSDFLKNRDALKFIKKIGIEQPSIRDEIFNVIIPQYIYGGNIDFDKHFCIFFKYYRQCPQEEIEEFIDEIRDCEFINYNTLDDPDVYRGKASTIYMPSEELIEYFQTKPNTRFILYEEYLDLVGTSNEKQLKSFLAELGVKKSVSISTRKIEWREELRRVDLPQPRYSKRKNYEEGYIDGCKEIIDYIVKNKSLEKSVILWELLLDLQSECTYNCNLDFLLHGTCYYHYYSNKSITYESWNEQLLKNEAWLMNLDGEFVSPKNLSQNDLAEEYEINDYAKDLFKFLGVREENVITEEDNSNLTDSQREKVEIADYISANDITWEDLERLALEKKAHKLREQSNYDFDEDNNDNDELDEDEYFDDDLEGDNEVDETSEFSSQSNRTGNHKKLHKSTTNVAKDILNRTNSVPSAHTNDDVDDIDDYDDDEFIPRSIDFSRKAEIEKNKAAKAIDKIAFQEELHEKALNATKYTYGWFKALLELESYISNANNSNNREISISFGSVEREVGTKRTLILKYPNRNIPQFMEDLSDIPLLLYFGEQTKTLVIEVANVKSYTLRVKLKSHPDISNIDFSEVSEARIDAKSPEFLMDELRKGFNNLGYDDNFNMQENLYENIEFVFGPPGTGKTTHLARNILIPLMKNDNPLKILVLTPTNKSADVLVRKIMEIMQDDDSYCDWLLRFGGTGDEVIEQSPVYRDKTFDIRKVKKNVTISTIARFPYDFFMPEGARIFLNGIKWDYIVVDEASMIPLINIVYLLYKKTPSKFIIAGDPFQIEPITSVDMWKNENIYTMVQLNSFTEPHTIPYDYKVTLLTTQYRSIPSIGNIFSKLSYGGILSHYRSEDSQIKLNIEDELDIKPLNIIKFPVSKYESIYRSKRLNHSSSYQIYSALFTFEYDTFLANKIANANPNRLLRIGIIAPYRAQADLIEKLVASENIPSTIDIQVGTIHGFQGDECEIIFAVFNTPPNITAKKDMFLNKRNIINVSISRATDYLFIVMPNDKTENINNLRLVKRVERLINNSASYQTLFSDDLESLMFGNSNYLEENSFSTGHQSVNVYGLPEKQYEIRSEETAVDIQIHQVVDKQNQKVDEDNTNTTNEATQNNSIKHLRKRKSQIVVSPQYGQGEVIKQYIDKGTSYIDVKFENKTTTYEEEVAFKTKSLIKK
nr:AAA domain-containing protein [uncultured Ruminococcus sp.]